MPLQDIVGECVAELHGADLFDAAHGQLSQVPVAPAGVDAFTNRAEFVLRLAHLTPHSGTPSQHADTVPASRQIRIAAVFGLDRRAIDLDPLAMRPLDVVGVAEAPIGEMASRKMASQRTQLL